MRRRAFRLLSFPIGNGLVCQKWMILYIKFLKKEPYDENFQTSPISPAEQGVYEELRRQYEDQLE